MASCVYSRLATMLQGTVEVRDQSLFQQQVHAGLYYLRVATARNQARLKGLNDPLDQEVERVAGFLLPKL